MRQVSTLGGNRLRALREATGKTQLDVELDANLGSGYLQRVESGKVGQPERETLERILAALVAPYTERRDILELFGYVVETTLPSPEETRWAAEACLPVLGSVPFPAYLLDCAHRLTVWNVLAPKLFGLDANGMAKLENVSMLQVLFDPAYGISPLIHNPDTFFPAAIRALRYEMRRFRGERWYEAVLADLLRCSLFKQYWLALQSEPLLPVAARPLTLIELDIPSAGLSKFRLTSEVLAEDRRFRVIYYLPADPTTMQTCASWSEALQSGPR